MPLRRRYSDFACTLNTNASVNSGSYPIYTRELSAFLERDLFTPDTLQQLFPNTRLFRVRIISPVIEVGPKRKLLHVHWSMSILHSGTMKLSGLQKRWQDYINAAVSFIYRCNVDLRLISSSRAKNYNIKTQDEQIIY